MTKTAEEPRAKPGNAASRAAGLARNSHLLAINLRDLQASLVSEPEIDDEVDALRPSYKIEHSLRRGTEEQPSALQVKIQFDLVAGTEELKRVLFTLRAVFVAEYILNPGMPDAAAEGVPAFAASNSMVHIWPYYREIVQSVTWRMGLPPFPLPLFRVSGEELQPTVGAQKVDISKARAGTGTKSLPDPDRPRSS
jgi:preprotein translocase subunit SecB